MYVSGYGPGTYFGGVEVSGAISIFDQGIHSQFYNFVGSANTVADVMTVSTGNFWGAVTVNATAAIVTMGDIFNGAQSTFSGSLYALGIDASGDNLIFTSTGSAIAEGSKFSPNGVGPCWTYMSDGSSFEDLGGNTFTGAACAAAPLPLVVAASGANTVSSLAATLIGTTAGATIVVGVAWTGTASPSFDHCSDAHGNTFVQQGTTLTTGSTYAAARSFALVYALNNLSSGNDAVTCYLTGSTARMDVAPIEFTEADQVTPFDGVTTGSGSGTAVSSGALTTTSPSSTPLFLAVNNGQQSFASTSTGLTCSPFGTFSGFVNGCWGRIYANTAAYTISGSWPGNTDWAGFFLRVRAKTPGGYPQFVRQFSSGGVRLSPSNVAYTSGWGATPAAVTIGSHSDSLSANFTLTGGTAASLNPVFTVTFPKAFQVPPNCSALQVGGTQAAAFISTGTATTTAVPFTFLGTPVLSSTIVVQMNCQ